MEEKKGKPRGQQTMLGDADFRVMLAERHAEAARLDQADEKAKIQTVGLGIQAAGLALFILAGLTVTIGGFLWKENIMIGSIGAVMTAVGVGLATVAQGMKMFGKGNNNG